MSKVNIIECNLENPDHQEHFFRLLNMYITDEMGGGIALPESKKEQLITDLKAHPSSLLFLAESEGSFLGFSTCFVNYSTFKLKPYVYIHDIAVSPEARGKGIGKALLNGIINKAENMGCCKVTLEVRDDNLVAQNAYKNLGFAFCDPKMLYWEKHL